MAGWSSGAQVSLRAMAEFPDRIQCGVLLNGGGGSTGLAPGNHTLANSTISTFGRTCWTYRPGARVLGVGNAIVNNEIFDGPHQAILWGGNNHIIANNVLYGLQKT